MAHAAHSDGNNIRSAFQNVWLDRLTELFHEELHAFVSVGRAPSSREVHRVHCTANPALKHLRMWPRYHI
eukprot:9100782-Alexandrium_andersonii.AAC.1